MMGEGSAGAEERAGPRVPGLSLVFQGWGL